MSRRSQEQGQISLNKGSFVPSDEPHYLHPTSFWCSSFITKPKTRLVLAASPSSSVGYTSATSNWRCVFVASMPDMTARR